MKSVGMLVAMTLGMGIGHVADGQERSAADQEKARRDQLRAAVQEFCPTSGRKLGEHGKPVKVKVGQEEIFLCCKACLSQKLDPKHWATIHGNFAKAQGKCPVMKKPLPKKPKWTIVEGKIIYICCPPCTKKIAADPATHLRTLDQYYLTSLRAKQSRR